MTIASLVYLLIDLLVLVLVLWLLWWAGNAIITLVPPPIQQVARVVLVVLIALICVGALLSLLDGGIFHPLRLGSLGSVTS